MALYRLSFLLLARVRATLPRWKRSAAAFRLLSGARWR